MKMYVLDENKNIRIETNHRIWNRWFKVFENRRVGMDILNKGKENETLISTVFLGIDHNWYGGEPLLFETMIFGGKHDGYQNRTSSWQDAMSCHEYVLKLVKGEENETQNV